MAPDDRRSFEEGCRSPREERDDDRLGINHTRVPVNAPHGVAGGARNYGRDGAMRFDAGSLYRVMKDEGRQHLVANIAGSLAQVSREDLIERSIAHFRAADKEYGDRVAAAVAAARLRAARDHSSPPR